ncbi:MAG: cytochrome c [Anaerolineales bacterium]|nr:cytochrome c [Anaerolineales bacterium]
MIKRLTILLGLVALAGSLVLLFTYDILKIDWISFMEIQPAYKPMEDPLPVPAQSIPVDGAAFVPGMGAPANPLTADEVSLARGAQLYSINCSHCHGGSGLGNGPVAVFLEPARPTDLTSEVVQNKSDGALFLTISNGVPGRMPALNENLTVRDRWDVVNFLRSLPGVGE